MKFLSVMPKGAVALVAFTLLTAGLATAQTPLGRLLLELEQTTRCSAQSDSWCSSDRSSWVNKVNQASTASRVAALMLEFEVGLKWEACTDAWPDRRNGWVSDVRGATSNAAVARLLAELETFMTWEATNDSWRSRRDGWVREVNAIR
jgi:hypothetical protein